MKLLLCPKCSEVFSLSYKLKSCSCGYAVGKYLDDEYSKEHGIGEYAGGFPIIFKNDSLLEAIRNQPKDGRGVEFISFVASDESILFRLNPDLKDKKK